MGIIIMFIRVPTPILQTERVLTILLFAAHAVRGRGGLVADGLARVAETLRRAADGVADALAEAADGVADGVGLDVLGVK